MKHEHVVEALSEYRDGALSAAAREDVSRHAAECAECAAVLSEWDRLSRAFLRRPAEPTPFQTEAFVARVMARLPASQPAPLAWLTGRWLVPALGLSVAVLALSFRPYGGIEAADPAAALLVGADGAAAVAAAAPESPGADVLGLGAEDR
ncbi:MAG TPA: zf-HC2 domain-containing protein [Elusimicrobiota bacterium]|nr:zf-HC2 domain-containing protein [Elusimicrobiota bacterium]